jgi:cbb3-type cytochrome oxidase subunit 3
MDVNELRIAVTLASLALFIALVAHTWSRNRRSEHDAAAMLPFVEEGRVPTSETRGENL